MTTPHLMNCQHSESGWCLECVKILMDERDSLGEHARVPDYDVELDAASKLVDSVRKENEQLKKWLADKSPGLTGVMLQAALEALSGNLSTSEQSKFTVTLNRMLKDKGFLL